MVASVTEIENFKQQQQLDDFIVRELRGRGTSARVERVRERFDPIIIKAMQTGVGREMQKLHAEPVKGIRGFRRSYELTNKMSKFLGAWEEAAGRTIKANELRKRTKQMLVLVEEILRRVKLD